MRTDRSWVFVLLGLVAAAGGCDASGAPPDVDRGTRRSESRPSDKDGGENVQFASKLIVTPPGEGSRFTKPEVEVMESAPVQFAVTVTMELPSPGYTVTVEDVGAPDDTGAIVAKVHQVAPKDPALTVLDYQKVRFALGSLKPRAYRLRIRVRAGDSTEYEDAQTVTMTAK